MITIRPADERGKTDWGWLDSRHTFSFGDYHDPEHQSFRQLRVINDDRVEPGQGFGTHPHRDMEILTYVLDGALEHKDSMGTGSVIKPGEIQRMSAGTGVMHSEFNASKSKPVRFLQIWIQPAKRGLVPEYEQKAFAPSDLLHKLHRLDITIHQDVALYAGRFDPGDSAKLELAKGRHAWVQVAKGEVQVNGSKLAEGDGAAISGEKDVQVRATTAAEVLVFDLA